MKELFTMLQIFSQSYSIERQEWKRWQYYFHSAESRMCYCIHWIWSISCSYGISKSICKTAFISTSHIIRKHEHIFGISARWALATSEENRQRILLNIVVLHFYRILYFYDKYMQKISSVTMEIHFPLQDLSAQYHKFSL